MANNNFYRTRPSKVILPEEEAGRAVNKCAESSVVVEFRPLITWDGEFGFDWLRVTEAEARDIEQSYIKNANNHIVAFTPNNATFGLVQDGYGAAGDLGAEKAQKKIKTEYATFVISDKGRASESRHLIYYVPYLNLYPQIGLAPLQVLAAELTEYAATEPRPCKAELRMIIDIKGQSPESIEIEFNNKDFDITLNIADAEIEIDGEISSLKIPVPRNYTPTPDTAATSRKVVAGANDLIVTITCLRSLTSNKEINVYAYHEQDDTAENRQAKEDLEKINKLHNKANPGDPNDPTTVILTTQKLAGKLIVLQNDVSKQKELKVLMVKVETNIASTGVNVIGVFTAQERKKLYNVLHQALIHPRLIERKNGNDFVLNLSTNANFSTTTSAAGIATEGKFIHSGGIYMDHPDFNTELLALYDANPDFPSRGNYFLVFCFAAPPYDGTLGQVMTDNHRNNIKSIMLFKDHINDDATIPHEGLHGLQLRHTHRDKTPLQHPNCKYIFPHSNRGARLSTSNIMSYNANSNAYSSWLWQWKEIQKHV